MPDFKLTANTPLDGYSHDFDGIKLAEITGKSLISMAIPNGSDTAFAKALKSALKVALPEIGKSENSSFKKAKVMRLQRDQLFVLFDYDGADATVQIPASLRKASYLTNQTDNWVMLQISGPKSIEALERMCQLDLHPDVFKPGNVARTSLEHMGAIILCEKPGDYLLFSASSSAKSFLHAVETSIKNVM